MSMTAVAVNNADGKHGEGLPMPHATRMLEEAAILRKDGRLNYRGGATLRQRAYQEEIFS
jgi:hypothetical protein